MCSIAFCASMIQFQNRLTKEPRAVAPTIKFFASTNDAETFFAGSPDFEAVVMFDTTMGVPTEFFLHPPEHECEISPYPLPTVDWDRVRRKIATTTEAPEYVGNVYNFDPAASEPVQGQRYVKVPVTAVREMKVVKLRRGTTLADVQTVHVDVTCPSTNHGQLAYTGCVGSRKILR
ncbi:hypothetical protein EBT31_12565 [bacterium]|nr:hypothetical protein [bacterium]